MAAEVAALVAPEPMEIKVSELIKVLRSHICLCFSPSDYVRAQLQAGAQVPTEALRYLTFKPSARIIRQRQNGVNREESIVLLMSRSRSCRT